MGSLLPIASALGRCNAAQDAKDELHPTVGLNARDQAEHFGASEQRKRQRCDVIRGDVRHEQRTALSLHISERSHRQSVVMAVGLTSCL